jgi:hypothetical protein
LLSAEGELISTAGAQPQLYRYRVRDADGAPEREVIVGARKFPVDDTAIDGIGRGCVQTLLKDFAPHAVISMGVTGWSDDKAEFHADSGGMRISNRMWHDDRAHPLINLPDNYSLARAIVLGNQARHNLVSGVIAVHNRSADDR